MSSLLSDIFINFVGFLTKQHKKKYHRLLSYSYKNNLQQYIYLIIVLLPIHSKNSENFEVITLSNQYHHFCGFNDSN